MLPIRTLSARLSPEDFALLQREVAATWVASAVCYDPSDVAIDVALSADSARVTKLIAGRLRT